MTFRPVASAAPELPQSVSLHAFEFVVAPPQNQREIHAVPARDEEFNQADEFIEYSM